LGASFPEDNEGQNENIKEIRSRIMVLQKELLTALQQLLTELSREMEQA
jgi:hypothetical protein